MVIKQSAMIEKLLKAIAEGGHISLMPPASGHSEKASLRTKPDYGEPVSSDVNMTEGTAVKASSQTVPHAEEPPSLDCNASNDIEDVMVILH